jgi:DNA uptake protein ComE-like DNA-binding protein
MASKSAERPSLYVHEWLAVVAVLSFVTVLTLLTNRNNASFSSSHIGEGHFMNDPYVEVRVEGAVVKPGIYRMKRGQTLQEVLDIAQVLPDANLKKIKLQSKVRANQVIHVLKKKPNSGTEAKLQSENTKSRRPKRLTKAKNKS